MELTAEQIKNNWDKFHKYMDYISPKRTLALKKFYKKYEDRIILMPASHKPQYHNCFPGGYIDHVNRVIEAALKLDKVWREMGVTVNYTIEELVFSAMNHDLGKMGTPEEEAYLIQTDQWRKDKLNEPYMFNDKIEFMSVPDRSLFLLQTHGIEYTKNEYLAIKLHDGIYDEANKPYLLGWLPEQKPRTSLIYIIHHADFLASRIEFEREWFPKFTKLETTTTNPGTLGTPAPKIEIKKPINNAFPSNTKFNNMFDKLFEEK